MKTPWPAVQLVTVCDRITVGWVGPMVDEYVEAGIPFLRSQNILPFRIAADDIKFISPEFHERIKKSALHAGDVAVVRTGYPGTAAVIPTSLGEANCADLVVITPGAELDSGFLTALFNSSWGVASVGRNLVGSAQQHFNVGAAKSMEVHLPPLSTQRKISSVLSAYDDLIENNNRRIKILEEMAHRIYHEWFVEFRYPGHDEVPVIASRLGLTPQGWRVAPIGEVTPIVGGGTPSKSVPEYWSDGTIVWYTPSDLTTADAMFISASKTLISEAGLAHSSAKLFPTGSIMLTSRATIGVVSITTVPATTNQGFITCLANTSEIGTYHLYFWLHEQRELIVSLASGATFKEINKTTFRAIPVLIAPRFVEAAFERLIAPLGGQIQTLLEAQWNLRTTRDLLLPRLVSGEVDIAELAIAVDEGAA